MAMKATTETRTPSISIVLVNQNGKKWLEIVLQSIQKVDYPLNKLELIMVDNGSTDGSVEFFNRECKMMRVKVLENKRNLGWSPANNQGARLANGEILAFLSNDMRVDAGWLTEIVKVMTLKPTIGVVQCNSISMADEKTYDSGMNFLDKYGFAYSYMPQEKAYPVFFAEGMAFAIRRDVFEKISGFDEHYFMEYDDMDLCWRVHLAGYEVYFAPSSIVYHARGGTVGSSYFTKRTRNITLYVRNHYATLLKNSKLQSLLDVILLVTSFQMAKALYFLTKRRLELTVATFKGCLMALRDFKMVWRKRQRLRFNIQGSADAQVEQLFHPFQPKLLYLFLNSQAKGKRLVLNMKPPMWRGIVL
jgi:GT2 family glycosyltransferase